MVDTIQDLRRDRIPNKTKRRIELRRKGDFAMYVFWGFMVCVCVWGIGDRVEVSLALSGCMA